MKTRQKLALFLTLIACSISLALFALVALGHYINQPARAERPAVGKLEPPTHDPAPLLQTEPILSPKPSESSKSDSEQEAEDRLNHSAEHKDRLAHFRKFNQHRERHHYKQPAGDSGLSFNTER